MHSIADTVRSIRRRLRVSQADFAAMLGVKQNTVSQYETGRVVPGPLVLLLLVDLAKTPEERAVLLKAIHGSGTQGSATAQSMRTVVEALREQVQERAHIQASRDLRRQRLQADFFRSVNEIVDKHLFSVELNEILDLWIASTDRRRASSFLKEAVSYLRVRLEGLKRPEGADTVSRVMIRCPEKGLPVFTGVTVTEREFVVGSFNGMEVFCPHCHITHTWNKPDAFLEGV